MSTKFYLAYGSNMDLDQMAHRCPDARLLGPSEIEGWQLLFKGSMTGSYATIEPQGGGTVPVLVWEISERDERNLDRYEGFPRFYRKVGIPVKVGGRELVAMAYVMDESRPLGCPTDYYFGVVEDAYDRFSFDKTILEKALEDSCPDIFDDPFALVG